MVRVLIVYPPGQWQKFVRQVLLNDGYLVGCVASAAAACANLDADDFGVVIVDGELQNEGWSPVVKKCRELDIPAIVHTRNDTKRAEIEQATAAYVFKADSPQELLIAVTELAPARAS